MLYPEQHLWCASWSLRHINSRWKLLLHLEQANKLLAALSSLYRLYPL